MILADYCQAAEQHASARDWYSRQSELVSERFAFPDLFVACLAATSPRMTITRNTRAALDAYNFVQKPGARYMRTHLPNIGRAWLSLPLSGPKVGPFHLALCGDTSAVVIDVHMFRLFGLDHERQRITDLRKAQRKVRRIAALLGWQPAETQAALWSYQLQQTTPNAAATDYRAALERLP